MPNASLSGRQTPVGEDFGMPMKMKNFISTACLAIFTGCALSTTQPTQIQFARCRAEMYLQTNLVFQAHWMKLVESGLDDAIWLKFSCEVKDPAQIFRTNIMDVSKLRDRFKHVPPKDIPWWDVEGRNLSGGQVTLPSARFMNVGMDATDTNLVVYTVWHET